MKNKKISNVFVIVCFSLFLLAAFAAGVLRDKETYSYFENRNLAKMPELTKEAVISGEYFSDVETYLKDHAVGRSTLLKLDTLINMNLLKRPVVNEVVVQKDILLPYHEFAYVNEDEIAAQASMMVENLTVLDDIADEHGAEFFYVLVPCQYYCYGDEYPWYFYSRNEYIVPALEAFKEEISHTDVELIDVGQIFSEADSPRMVSSLIDNHNSMYGAYLTYVEIMEAVNDKTGLNLSVLKEGAFEFEELPNRYVGSLSRKVMELWENDEKLSMLVPNVTVPFTRYDNGAVSDSPLYYTPENDYDWLNYNFYMGGDIPETVIDTGREELPSVLIYGDSFTNAVETVLYYGFDEMRSLDLRYYHEKTLREYIEEYKPDVVICLRNYSAIIDTTDNGRGADEK